MISKFCYNILSKSLNTKMVRYNSQLFQQAQIAQSVGHYNNAIQFYQQFLQNTNNNVDSKQVFNSHKFMGEAFLKLNRMNQSHNHYSKALEEFQKMAERDSSEEISLLNKVAETCPDLKKALEYTEKSLSLINYQNDNALQMESLRVKAQILEKMGLRQDSLNICGQILMESESTTSVDYKFAQKKRLVLQSLETFSEVSKELDQIIISEHKSNTPDTPEAISEYYQISQKLWKKKDFFRSFQYVQRALQLAEVLRGTAHKDFYQCLESIGKHLVMQGRLFEAQFYYEKALKCVVQGRGPYHEDVIHYQKSLADLYFQQEKYQLAQKYYEEALVLEQKYYPLDASQTLDTNFKITMTEYKQGKNVLEIKENLEWMLGQFSKKVAVKNEKLQSQILQELAKINLELNKISEAKRCFQEFLVIEDNLDLMLDAYLNLGYIEMMNKDFEKANQIFERCKLFVKDQSHPKFQKIAEQQILVQQQMRN